MPHKVALGFRGAWGKAGSECQATGWAWGTSAAGRVQHASALARPDALTNPILTHKRLFSPPNAPPPPPPPPIPAGMTEGRIELEHAYQLILQWVSREKVLATECGNVGPHCVLGDSSMRRVHARSCQVNGMIQGGAWRKDPNEARTCGAGA